MDLQHLESPIFNINLPTGKPAIGKLLVAEPFLKEEYFNHSVVSLVEYEPGQSSMGLVLNKPTGYTLADAIEGIHEEVDIPIFCGGPMSYDRLFYLHSFGEEFRGSRKISDGLYIGGDFEAVKSYVNMGLDTEGKIRFFVGYSGWDAGQLEDEIKNHVWAVTPCQDPADIFAPGDSSLWYKVVRSMGPAYRNWKLHPVNPQLN